MDALLGAMEPTIHRLSILPSVTARRKPHGGYFRAAACTFLGPSYSPIAGAAVPGLPPGEGAERSEVDEEWRYLADQQAGSIQMQHSFFLTGLHIYQVVPRVMRANLFLTM